MNILIIWLIIITLLGIYFKVYKNLLKIKELKYIDYKLHITEIRLHYIDMLAYLLLILSFDLYIVKHVILLYSFDLTRTYILAYVWGALLLLIGCLQSKQNS
ncbi:hypothetical protein KQI42_19365 [Tissierella sp. MSJ-40]|uniref:DUF3784 domain-containing protein n=1 Tax=Tissierella simiarum TaxID=2841534 RepID=A0ABS6EBB3_9FIRM|nr:hypothetical protein [Tissierella simiarum]MBU5440156.1 hypothetical protein [Tissierella simiarum]